MRLTVMGVHLERGCGVDCKWSSSCMRFTVNGVHLQWGGLYVEFILREVDCEFSSS